jgi:O-6-methylguanine DNA methyltransferase
MNSSFIANVYQIVKAIPRGSVATYKEVARLAGNPAAARAVGAAMSHNPDPRTIPCHRVVGTDGSLRGYGFGKGLATKRSLLLKEGVVMKGDRVDLSMRRFVKL